MKNLINTFKDARVELSKVIFPTKQQVRSAFFSVFLVVTFVSIFLFLVDLTMSSSISAIVGN
jgi:preprotein translocase subunit SecE